MLGASAYTLIPLSPARNSDIIRLHTHLHSLSLRVKVVAGRGAAANWGSRDLAEEGGIKERKGFEGQIRNL
jgi:hypothetical protein